MPKSKDKVKSTCDWKSYDFEKPYVEPDYNSDDDYYANLPEIEDSVEEILSEAQAVQLEREHKQIFVKLIETLLRVNVTTTSLLAEIEFIPLTIESIKVISRAIKVSKSVTSLKLYNCEIYDEGAILLFNGLKDNRKITHLNLGHNHIGSGGHRAIMDMLKYNRKIQCINLYENYTPDESNRYHEMHADILEEMKSLMETIRKPSNPVEIRFLAFAVGTGYIYKDW